MFLLVVNSCVETGNLLPLAIEDKQSRLPTPLFHTSQKHAQSAMLPFFWFNSAGCKSNICQILLAGFSDLCAFTDTSTVTCHSGTPSEIFQTWFATTMIWSSNEHANEMLTYFPWWSQVTCPFHSLLFSLSISESAQEEKKKPKTKNLFS